MSHRTDGEDERVTDAVNEPLLSGRPTSSDVHDDRPTGSDTHFTHDRASSRWDPSSARTTAASQSAAQLMQAWQDMHPSRPPSSTAGRTDDEVEREAEEAPKEPNSSTRFKTLSTVFSSFISSRTRPDRAAHGSGNREDDEDASARQSRGAPRSSQSRSARSSRTGRRVTFNAGDLKRLGSISTIVASKDPKDPVMQRKLRAVNRMPVNSSRQMHRRLALTMRHHSNRSSGLPTLEPQNSQNAPDGFLSLVSVQSRFLEVEDVLKNLEPVREMEGLSEETRLSVSQAVAEEQRQYVMRRSRSQEGAIPDATVVVMNDANDRTDEISAPASPPVAATVHAASMQNSADDSFTGRLRFAWNCFRIGFTLLCTLLAIWQTIVILRDPSGPGTAIRKTPKLFGVHLISWAFTGATLFPGMKAARNLIRLLFVILEYVLSKTGAQNSTFVLMGLTKSARRIAYALQLQVMLLILLPGDDDSAPPEPAPDPSRGGPGDTDVVLLVRHMSYCILIFTIVELSKSVACRLLSLRVHAKRLLTRLSGSSTALEMVLTFKRVQETVYKEQVLNKLMCKPTSETFVECSARINAMAKARGIACDSAAAYLRALYALALPMDVRKKQSFADHITRLVTIFENINEEQCIEHAAYAAEYFWWTCKTDVAKEGVDVLLHDDIMSRLGDTASATYAFELFDANGDGYVVEEEVASHLRTIYRERRDFAKTLRDTEGVIKTLEALVGCVAHVCAGFAYLAIFGVDITHLVISLSSMVLAGTFIFGNSLKTIYESFVFLFVVHPYEVGDRIEYEGNGFIVRDFGLLSTRLLRIDGCIVSVPNQKLMGTDIVNISKSKQYRERISFEVDLDTCPEPLKVVEDLEARLVEMTQNPANSAFFNRDFQPFAYVQGIATGLKYQVGLQVEFCDNLDNVKWGCEGLTRVHAVVGDWLNSHNLINSSLVCFGSSAANVQLMAPTQGGPPVFADQPSASGSP